MIKLSNETTNSYLKLLAQKGEEGLYRHMLGIGMKKIVDIPAPEVEILEASEYFFSLYRRSGDERFFLIGKVFRRAANKLYREICKINSSKNKDVRFLNVVKCR